MTTKSNIFILCVFVASPAIFVNGANTITKPNDTWLDEYYRACKSHFDFLKNNSLMYSSEALVLAIQIKTVFKTKSKNQRLISEFMKLKRQLPTTVQKLIFNEYSNLFSKAYDREYLLGKCYAESYENRRDIYTWIPGGAIGENPQGDWVFLTQDEGKTFMLKNAFFDEYLYPETDEVPFDEMRRNVFTWKLQSAIPAEGFWNVEIVNDNEIRIKSATYNEYLYAEKIEYAYDKDQRRVFTAKEGFKCDKRCNWILG